MSVVLRLFEVCFEVVRVLLKRYFECCLRLFEGCFEVVLEVVLRLF